MRSATRDSFWYLAFNSNLDFDEYIKECREMRMVKKLSNNGTATMPLQSFVCFFVSFYIFIMHNRLAYDGVLINSIRHLILSLEFIRNVRSLLDFDRTVTALRWTENKIAFYNFRRRNAAISAQNVIMLTCCYECAQNTTQNAIMRQNSCPTELTVQKLDERCRTKPNAVRHYHFSGNTGAGPCGNITAPECCKYESM